jgi:hypothetical protein
LISCISEGCLLVCFIKRISNIALTDLENKEGGE